MTALSPAAERYARYVNPAFAKLLASIGFSRAFVRAEGFELWDEEDRHYLDFYAGSGVHALGHNPPRITERLQRALAAKIPNATRAGPEPWAGELAEALAQRVPHLPMSLFSCSGGEAIEAAIKLARAATGRPGIVYCKGGSHGASLGGLSIRGATRWRRPFEPLLPECYEVFFGDVEELDILLEKHRVAAFIVEPVQADAGVLEAPAGFFVEAQAVCRRHGVLVVVDEVQTGLGRTGRRFAFERYPGFLPDVLVLGKALGGSLLPISVTMTTRELQTKAYGGLRSFDLHGSTFSGNSLACIVALETLAAIDDEGLVDRAERVGTRFRARLEARLAGHPIVKDVRGVGLLIGIELGPTGTGRLQRFLPSAVKLLSRQVLGQWLALRLLELGFLCQPASQDWSVLKLTPPLTITDDAADALVDAAGAVLDDYRDFLPLVRDVGKRLGTQLLQRDE